MTQKEFNMERCLLEGKRVMLPAEFRSFSPYYISYLIAPEKPLLFVTENLYISLEDRMNSYDNLMHESKIIKYAWEKTEMDKTGRIYIPKFYLDFIDNPKLVRIIGSPEIFFLINKELYP